MLKHVQLAIAAASVASTLGLAGQVQASVLTFNGNICQTPTGFCGNYDFINQSYGDTDLVDVQYSRDVTNNGFVRGAANNALEFWNNDYNELVNVAWGGTSNTTGTPEIFLRALGGSTVTLNGFDLGAYSHTQRGTQITLVDGLGNVLYSSGAITVGSGDVHSHFAFNVSSNTGIGIQWGPNGFNVGIDNVEFNGSSITGGVPEPATWAMIVMGFGALGAVFRRRRTASLAVQ